MLEVRTKVGGRRVNLRSNGSVVQCVAEHVCSPRQTNFHWSSVHREQTAETVNKHNSSRTVVL